MCVCVCVCGWVDDWVCVCVYPRARVCMCVCVCAWISASTRSILTGEFSFSSFFYVMAVRHRAAQMIVYAGGHDQFFYFTFMMQCLYIRKRFKL